MTIILLVIVVILTILVMGLAALIAKLQNQIELLDKEQHNQNKDILDFLKFKGESIKVLIEHSTILAYLAEQDPVLSNSKKIVITGQPGEA